MRNLKSFDALTRRHGDAGMMSMKVSFVIVCLIMLLGLSLDAQAQQPSSVTAMQTNSGAAGVYAIRNARIVTVSGSEIENGTLIIRDGKIEAVGASATVPVGAQEIDARGLFIYPG